MVEAPLDLQAALALPGPPSPSPAALTVPQNHIDSCIAEGKLFRGNAAGNEDDLLNLKGQNKSPAPLPAGFTAKGIVALVFSCIAAVLGMLAVTWYGTLELKRGPETVAGVAVGGEQ